MSFTIFFIFIIAAIQSISNVVLKTPYVIYASFLYKATEKEFVVADDCLASARNESTKNYVSCLKQSIVGSRNTYEVHLALINNNTDGFLKQNSGVFRWNSTFLIDETLPSKNHHVYVSRNVAKKCFIQKTSNTSCDLPENEFSAVSWNARPKDCPQCAMRKSESKGESQFIRPEDSVCLRARVAEQLILEVERCMKKKNIDIIPAFRSLISIGPESTNVTTQVSNEILDYMTIYTRLATCALSNGTIAKKTSDCVDGSLHGPINMNCKIQQSCESNIPVECKDSLTFAQNSFCSCLTEIQTSIRERFTRIGMPLLSCAPPLDVPLLPDIV